MGAGPEGASQYLNLELPAMRRYRRALSKQMTRRRLCWYGEKNSLRTGSIGGRGEAERPEAVAVGKKCG